MRWSFFQGPAKKLLKTNRSNIREPAGGGDYAALVAAQSRALIDVEGHLEERANLMLRLEGKIGEHKSPDLYAKVLKPLTKSGKRYLIHFTSIPPDMQVGLQRLTDGVKGH